MRAIVPQTMLRARRTAGSRIAWARVIPPAPVIAAIASDTTRVVRWLPGAHGEASGNASTGVPAVPVMPGRSDAITPTAGTPPHVTGSPRQVTACRERVASQ
jgi:hypothetical protein